jgi:hypothetical protein
VKIFIVILAVYLSSCASPPQLDSMYDPCHDARYIALKAKGADKLTDSELTYYIQKESDCFSYQLEIAKFKAAEETTTTNLLTVLAITTIAALIILVTAK